MSNKLNKKLSLLFLVFFPGAIFLIFSSFFIKPKVIEIGNNEEEILPAQVSQNLLKEKQTKEDKEVTIIVVGDIMLVRGVENMMKKNNDWRWPFLKIADNLKEADILFGNLEGAISDKGIKVGSINSFRANPKAIEGLKFSGFNVLSLANNHALDYSKKALKDTFDRLKKAGIDYVGGGLNKKEAYSPIIKEVNGTKIGFLAYNNIGSPYWAAKENYPGIAWADWQNIEEIKTDIQKAKDEVDILIVSLHAGKEYTQDLNQLQISFAKDFVESGADLVIGHHPHVVQKNESLKNGWIFYSLGNFIFDQNFSQATMEGQMVKVIVENCKIKEATPIPIQLNKYFQPEIQQ